MLKKLASENAVKMASASLSKAFGVWRNLFERDVSLRGHVRWIWVSIRFKFEMKDALWCGELSEVKSR